MGWDFAQGATKKSTVQEILSNQTLDGYVSRVVAQKTVKNNLWVVWEIDYPAGKKRVLSLYMLAKFSGCGAWGYKAIDESMGPYESNCPLQFLELAIDGVNTAFRERVKDAGKVTL